MAKQQFNLSVLENVTTFDTPQKECSDYESIISLIKEEIDIDPTEDEMDYHKTMKTPRRATKRKNSELYSSEIVFKSPYKKKYSLKLKSPGLLLNGKKEKLLESQGKNNARENRARSLGRVKPGRSFLANHRRNRSSISHSETSALSDFGDDTIVETPKKILENGIRRQTDEQNGLEFKICSNTKEHAVDSSNADDEISVSSKGESTSLATTDPLDVENANDSFVKSSQNTTTSSELRQKLSRRRSTVEVKPPITNIMKDGLQTSPARSEDENEHFSLTLSPDSKSSVTTVKKESSATPPRVRKRKAVCRVSPLKGLRQDRKNSIDNCSSSSQLRLRRQNSSTPLNPLNGLTQELENCIRNGDYVEMCDSETESMSFTFETIQLLNEYEDCNQHANNNKILDKILSSPSRPAEEETPTIVDNVTSSKCTEDPLHIDYANADIPPTTSTTKKPKAAKRKSNLTRIPKKGKKQSNKIQTVEVPLHIDHTDNNEDVPPSTQSTKRDTKTKTTRSKRKSLVIKTLKSGTKRASEAQTKEDSPQMYETDADLLPSTSKRKKNVTKMLTEPDRKSTEVANSNIVKRRSSNRLENKVPANMRISDCESDDPYTEAAKLAENIAAAEEEAALSTKILNQLENLNVQLRHEVLPQHEIEVRAGSKVLSYKQQKEFLKYAPLNKGTYTPAEDEIIKKNWNTFCEDHDWNPNDYKPFIRFKHGKQLIMSSLEERRKFVQFLANGLPNRPLCSVYNRFRLIYNKYDAAGSRYTEKEDAKIIAYMTCNSNEPPEQRYAELAKVMNRSRISIWKRHTKLVQKNCATEKKKRVLTKVEWDLPLVEEFITTLLDVTLSDELIDLKDAFLPRVVWLKMEDKMEINYDVMQRFWDQKLHQQLFAPEPISMNEIKIKLIEYMNMNKVSNSKEIKWDTVARYFDGYTIPFLRYVFNHLTLNASGTLQTREFTEILKWLHSKKINELRFSLKDKCLPRIAYKNKHVELVAEDLARVRLLSEQSDDD